MSLPTIDKFMDTVVHTVSPDASIMDAIKTLLAHKVTGAPVVDDDGRVVGVLSERDCLKLLAMGDTNAERASGKVSDYMNAKPVTAKPGMNIYFVAGMFLNDDVRRYPVVDDDDRVVGMITRYDIVRAVDAGL